MRVLKGKAWFERRYFFLHQQSFEAVWCFRRSTGTFEGKRGVFWRKNALISKSKTSSEGSGWRGILKLDKNHNIFKPKFWKSVTFFEKIAIFYSQILLNCLNFSLFWFQNAPDFFKIVLIFIWEPKFWL